MFYDLCTCRCILFFSPQTPDNKNAFAYFDASLAGLVEEKINWSEFWLSSCLQIYDASFMTDFGSCWLSWSFFAPHTAVNLWLRGKTATEQCKELNPDIWAQSPQFDLHAWDEDMTKRQKIMQFLFFFFWKIRSLLWCYLHTSRNNPVAK